MKKVELVSEILELAQSLDRGDITIDEATIQAGALVNDDRSELLNLHAVGCSVILKEINKQIDKYYEDHKHCNIVTCDLCDVYKWLKKAEKKAKKKLRKK